MSKHPDYNTILNENIRLIVVELQKRTLQLSVNSVTVNYKLEQ